MELTDREAALAPVRAWLGDRRPLLAIVLGSGLGRLVNQLEQAHSLPYAAIPGFPPVAVAGHAGALHAGRIAGRMVLLQSGRFHLYQGHSPETVVRPVRLYAALGIPTLVVTNAAGGIRGDLAAGSLMLLADHLNLMFASPLWGAPPAGEPRCPDLSAPYDPELRRAARRVALAEGIPLSEGVYAAVLGPSYETPAEIRLLRGLGADAVGMSTVPEVLAARAAGLRCVGLSIITNRAAGLGSGRLSHADVLQAGEAAADRVGRLLARLIAEQ